MKTTILTALALILGNAINAQSTSFESSEGYSLGLINGQNGWTVSSLFTNMFTVNNTQSSNGSNSLKLDIDQTGWIPGGSVVGPSRNISAQVPLNPDTYEVSADLYFTSTTTPQSEIDFHVYGAGGVDAIPGSIMALANGFVRIIELNDLTVGATVVVPNDVFTNLKVKFDFVNNQTLHYVNGVLAYTGPLNLSKVTAYGFLTTGRTVGYVDNIITAANSLATKDFTQNTFSHYISENRLHLQSKTLMAQMEIYNMGGQKILSKSVNSDEGTIEIGDLANGIYLARVSFEGEVRSFKFIK